MQSAFIVKHFRDSDGNNSSYYSHAKFPVLLGYISMSIKLWVAMQIMYHEFKQCRIPQWHSLMFCKTQVENTDAL